MINKSGKIWFYNESFYWLPLSLWIELFESEEIIPLEDTEYYKYIQN